MLSPSSIFQRLAGYRRYAPPVLTVVQTDGFFRPSNGSAGVVARITRAHELVDESISPLYDISSLAEVKWASLYYGLLLAQANKEASVGLETNSRTVVHSLLGTQKPTTLQPTPSIVFYKCKIMNAAEGLNWCGIRWVPSQSVRRLY